MPKIYRNPIDIKNTHPMNRALPKNYDVILAFIVFLICIMISLFVHPDPSNGSFVMTP